MRPPLNSPPLTLLFSRDAGKTMHTLSQRSPHSRATGTRYGGRACIPRLEGLLRRERRCGGWAKQALSLSLSLSPLSLLSVLKKKLRQKKNGGGTGKNM